MLSDQISEINIPVIFKLDELESIINQQLAGNLHEDDNLNDGDNMLAKVERIGDIDIRIVQNHIFYKVPVSIWIKKRIAISQVEIVGEIALIFKTNVNINADWSLETNTELLEHEWLSSPKVKLAIIDIPVRMIADQVLEKNAAKISSAIDQKIGESIDLRQQMDKVWEKIKAPLLIDENFKLWLCVQPRGIYMTPIQSDKESVRTSICIKTMASLVMGNPTEIQTDLALPPFTETHESETDTQLYMNIAVPYTEATLIARQFACGKQFEQMGREVIVEDIELSGDEKQMYINLTLSGDYKGEIKLTVLPSFSAEDGTVRFSNIDYSLETSNLLHKGVSFLLKNNLLKRIEEQLTFPVFEKLEDLKAKINARLQHFEVSPDIYLHGKLMDLSIQKMLLRPHSIRIEIQARATMELRILGLSLPASAVVKTLETN